MTDLQTYLQTSRQEIDAALSEFLQPVADHTARLHKAMQHSVLAGGKRLRPILALTTADLLGGSRQLVMPLACATEVIHSASLILDDLPCMDNATLRRGGKPTHRAYGEDGAILAAISLLMLGCELIVLTGERTKCNVSRLVAAVRAAAGAVGSDGMAGGQYADLHQLGPDAGLAEVEFVHSRKTGALFAFCLEATATVLGANNAETEALSAYAKNLGLAFQIADDLLDATASPDQTGKDVRRDTQKTTFVDLCGIEKAGVIALDLVETAKASLSLFGPAAERLLALADYVVERKF